MALNASDYRKFDLAAQVARRRLTFLLFRSEDYYLAFGRATPQAQETLRNTVELFAAGPRSIYVTARST
jgi:hypothetical protein